MLAWLSRLVFLHMHIYVCGSRKDKYNVFYVPLVVSDKGRNMSISNILHSAALAVPSLPSDNNGSEHGWISTVQGGSCRGVSIYHRLVAGLAPGLQISGTSQLLYYSHHKAGCN